MGSGMTKPYVRAASFLEKTVSRIRDMLGLLPLDSASHDLTIVEERGASPPS